MRPEIATSIRRYYAKAQDEIGIEEIMERVTASGPGMRRLPQWSVTVAAFAAVFLIGGMSGLLWAGSGPNAEVAAVPPSTPAASGPDGVEGEGPFVDAWNPILATRVASPAPPAEACPEGADPDTPGSVEQQRPWGAQWSNQAAVFDRHTGVILFVDESGDTWAFDVCTNTWRLEASDAPAFWGRDRWVGPLVYDVDSGVTVSFAGGSVSVYDAGSGVWTQSPRASGYEVGMFGAAYDPVSGLMILQTDPELVAYDVESDTWTPLRKFDEVTGVREGRRCGRFLIGYLPATDQFAFTSRDCSVLIDLRTGASTVVDMPFDDLFAPFGRLNYANGAGAPILMDDSICRLGPTTLEWTCVDMANGPGTFDESAAGAGLLAAIVEDPINDRVVLIYGYGPGFNGKRFYDVNDIWAVDFDSGEWTLLLERAGGMTLERTIDDRP